MQNKVVHLKTSRNKKKMGIQKRSLWPEVVPTGLLQRDSIWITSNDMTNKPIILLAIFIPQKRKLSLREKSYPYPGHTVLVEGSLNLKPMALDPGLLEGGYLTWLCEVTW